MSDFLETTGICVFIVIGIALGYYTLLGLGYNRQLGLCEEGYNVHQCELVALPKGLLDE